MIKIEENKVIQEKANGWLVALSILVPLAGLIIFITQKDKQPKTAKVSGICALISFVVSIIIISIFTFVIVPTTVMVMVADDNGLLEKSKVATSQNAIAAAKDTVSIYVGEALNKYITDKYTNNKNTDISKYLIDALKKAKKEVSQNGISLTTSGNKIYLSSDRYKVSATVSEEGNIKWSDIEE